MIDYSCISKYGGIKMNHSKLIRRLRKALDEVVKIVPKSRQLESNNDTDDSTFNTSLIYTSVSCLLQFCERIATQMLPNLSYHTARLYIHFNLCAYSLSYHFLCSTYHDSHN